ncbi:response regulator [Alkalihalophilus sp. As8PL]|uniref:Response regulator n=1 Tax=Alkalihalophilus sp. As8PL TaxID=3237103 RepID=A0AB39BV27_9BACI
MKNQSDVNQNPSLFNHKTHDTTERLHLLCFCENPLVASTVEEHISTSEGEGYLVCDDTEKAIELFYEQKPKAVVLIYATSGVTVKEFYDSIYRQCMWENIPIFYSSTITEVIPSSHHPKIDNFIRFPFELKELELRMNLKAIQKQSAFLHLTDASEETVVEIFYRHQVATLERQKTPFTMVFLKVSNVNEIKQEHTAFIAEQVLIQMADFLLAQLRDTDMLFKVSNDDTFALILPFTGEKEANYFLKRVYNNVYPVPCFMNQRPIEVDAYLTGSVVEIRDSKAQLKEVVTSGTSGLIQAIELGAFQIVPIDHFKAPQTESIKVSIIEQDPIVNGVLLNILQRHDQEDFTLDIKTFQDGQQFLQSGWHVSSHTHLIIINDILPKKDGLEVIYELRELPNTNKYLIIMLSTKKSENDMIHAYELGVDDYVRKPFNVKMLEAQIKRFLKRLR